MLEICFSVYRTSWNSQQVVCFVIFRAIQWFIIFNSASHCDSSEYLGACTVRRHLHPRSGRIGQPRLRWRIRSSPRIWMSTHWLCSWLLISTAVRFASILTILLFTLIAKSYLFISINKPRILNVSLSWIPRINSNNWIYFASLRKTQFLAF